MPDHDLGDPDDLDLDRTYRIVETGAGWQVREYINGQGGWPVGPVWPTAADAGSWITSGMPEVSDV